MLHAILDTLVEAAGTRLPLVILIVKATLILLAALGATALLRRASAGTRHLIWLVTLGALLVVPALARWGPIPVAILTASASAAPSSPESHPGAASTDAPHATGQSYPLPAPQSAPTMSSTGTFTPPATDAAATWSAPAGVDLVTLASIWAVVALGIALSLGLAAMAVHRIVRASAPLDTSDWVDPLYEVSDRLGLEEAPRLLRSTEAKMPFACGILRPTIVLPAESDHWTPERRRAVLLHELAHVKRRDLVGHTIGHVACALYWFHPLVWSGARKLRAESERACDDMALACGARPSDYAEHLLDIVTSVKGDRTPALAMAMARRKEFEGRMLSILDPELRRTTASRRQAISLAGSFALLVLLVGAAAPVERTHVVEADVAALPYGPQSDPTEDDARPGDFRPLPDLPYGAAESPAMPTPPPVAQDPGTPAVTAGATAAASAQAAAGAAYTDAIAAQQLSADVLDAVTPITDAVVRSVMPSVLRGMLGAQPASTLPADERAELLAKILQTDSSARVRRIAAWGLEEYPRSTSGIAALASAVRRDPSADVREMAAWALGDGGRSDVVTTALASALSSDRDDRVRATAAWALGSNEARSQLSAVTAALTDRTPAVRRAAIWAIGSMEPRQAPPELVRMLAHEDRQTRMLTGWALYTIEDPSTIGALQAALRTESDRDVQRAYLRALMALGEKSVDAIRAMLDSPDPELKQMAVRSLAGSQGGDPWPWPWPMPRPYP